MSSIVLPLPPAPHLRRPKPYSSVQVYRGRITRTQPSSGRTSTTILLYTEHERERRQKKTGHINCSSAMLLLSHSNPQQPKQARSTHFTSSSLIPLWCQWKLLVVVNKIMPHMLTCSRPAHCALHDRGCHRDKSYLVYERGTWRRAPGRRSRKRECGGEVQAGRLMRPLAILDNTKREVGDWLAMHAGNEEQPRAQQHSRGQNTNTNTNLNTNAQGAQGLAPLLTRGYCFPFLFVLFPRVIFIRTASIEELEELVSSDPSCCSYSARYWRMFQFETTHITYSYHSSSSSSSSSS